MDFYDSFLSLLEASYPETVRAINVRERLTPLLFCPSAVKLSRELAAKAREFAHAAFALRQLEERKTKLEADAPPISDPGNFSALMSYDFHVDSEGRLRLIEINTNAGMSLMSDLLYRLAGLENGFSADFQREIMETFKEEFALSGGKKLERVAIIDEKPENQRLLVEFYLYRELFMREGFEALIADPQELSFVNGELRLGDKRIDLVYNRDTDFYLETEASKALKAAMEAKAACISPHAHEYRLLGDKARLMELATPGVIDALPLSEEHKAVLRSAIIPAFSVKDLSEDEVWAQRKKLFFKPKRSFGGKAAYRGASISRGVFAQIVAGDYLAQEYVPPATLTIPIGEGKFEEFKYDLRFYAYKDRIQLACARLYHGQMTNSQTPGGGVAAIEWV